MSKQPIRISRFLILNFILLDVLIVTSGGVIAYRLGKHNLISVAEQNSVAIAHHLAWVLDEFYMRPWDLTFETFPYDDPNAYRELRGVTLRFLSGFKVERVNIFDNHYRVLFSTDSTLIGEEESTNSKLLSALAGKPVSSIEEKDEPADVPGEVKTKDYLEVYVPVETRSTEHKQVRLAFEVYLDISATQGKVVQLRNVIILSTGAIGLALLIVVILIARRAERLATDENRERMALAEQVRRQNEQLEEIVEERTRQLTEAQKGLVQMEKMAATGQLAAGVAHEINNPVSIIQNRLELLLEDLRDGREIPDMDQHLNLVHKHTQRISQIVSRLLSFSRKSTSERTPLQMKQIISDVLELVRKEVEKKGIKLITDVPEHLPQVMGNRTEIEQILINLILNARDATPQGGEIIIRGSVVSGMLHLQVADTGEGIAQEHLTRIFDPFFTTKGVGVGTGLGLAITYRLVADHGGDIVVASSPEHGTTFRISIPVVHNNLPNA